MISVPTKVLAGLILMGIIISMMETEAASNSTVQSTPVNATRGQPAPPVNLLRQRRWGSVARAGAGGRGGSAGTAGQPGSPGR